MRLVLAVAVSAAVVAAAAAPAPAATAPHHDCTPPGAKSVARDERGRVYYIERDGLQYYYACIYATGRTRPVGDNPHDSDLDIVALRLASPYVAFKQFYRSSQGDASDRRPLNIRTGRKLVLEEFGGIRRFLVTSFGAIVWVHSRDVGGVEIKKIDRGGRATLDHGTSIPGRSLHLSHSGHRVFWKTDGVAGSAP